MIYLLDGAAAGLVIIPLVLFMLLCGFVEGFFIYLFKVNRYWPGVAQALLVNIASLIIGYWIWPLLLGRFEGLRGMSLPYILIFLGVTIVAEGLLLKLLNRSKPWLPVWKASVAMNIVTYLILFFFFVYED